MVVEHTHHTSPISWKNERLFFTGTTIGRDSRQERMDQECQYPTLGEERDLQGPHGRDATVFGKCRWCWVSSLLRLLY